MKTKLMALILALLMVVPMFVACSDTTKDSESDKSKDSGKESETLTGDPEIDGYFNSMEAINMNGWTFRSAGGYGWVDNAKVSASHIHVEELLEDSFNAGIYNRLIDVSTKYNVKIEFPEIDAGVAYEEIKTDVLAGTNQFSIGFTYIEHGTSELVTGNYVRDFNDLPMDLSLPFFDKNSQKALTFNGKYFYLHSDASWSHNEAGCVLFFNGKILDNKQINKSPYDLWKEGKWTMDALQTMTEQGSTDVNNDAKYTFGTDILGVVGETYRYISPVLASGYDVMVWDEPSETFKVNITDENVMAIGKATRKLWFQSPWNQPDGTTKTQEEDLFKSDKVLFLSMILGAFRSLRDKEDNYGVITWPTIAENMDSQVHMRNPFCIVVTANTTGEKLEQNVSTLITAMAAYSYDYIMEDYIKFSVVAQGARDEQSAEVIRYVLDNRVYDVSAAIGAGISGGVWIECIEDGLFASRAKANKGKYEGMIAEALKPYYADSEE
ncbi:MAG: hypothetical protein E7672_04760 [Ruminococcaceae bacterium]|nr:hypothetical protein [Oscillospiraceae bacterium]